MSMKEWAKREVELACKKENPDRKDGEFDYGCACYESALKAFNSLMNDNHSGMSIHFTKQILNRLIDNKCLTPIEDTEDIWTHSHDEAEGSIKVYQCKRLGSLFKYVNHDGTVNYSDVNRFVGYTFDSDRLGIIPLSGHHSGMIDRVMEELFPIKMPYMPEASFSVYCQDVLTDRENGDYDTRAIWSYKVPGDSLETEIERFFAESQDYPDRKERYPGWVEITREEWDERVKIAAEREVLEQQTN